MKALPKRKGNIGAIGQLAAALLGLNESPSQKEGKYPEAYPPRRNNRASMKALPKRKGNSVGVMRSCDMV